MRCTWCPPYIHISNAKKIPCGGWLHKAPDISSLPRLSLYLWYGIPCDVKLKASAFSHFVHHVLYESSMNTLCCANSGASWSAYWGCKTATSKLQTPYWVSLCMKAPLMRWTSQLQKGSAISVSHHTLLTQHHAWATLFFPAWWSANQCLNHHQL